MSVILYFSCPSPAAMRPKIHDSCYVHPSAVIIGDVTIERECSIWPGAVLRGDLAPVTIGAGSNVQDNCVIHVTEDSPTVIGRNVSLGHLCMVHGATIHDDVIIGINSVLFNRSEIGAGSIVGVNAYVREGMKVPPGSLVIGTPAKIMRSGDASLLEAIRDNAKTYHMLRDRHKAGEFGQY